ncbi:hypothetical protein [Tabrizicola sp.]|uniref:hypothetical protein n=1 Tax=Tabrizicola sp. TaxID=2005166 RepID=UPI00286B9F51|nr:hypothetical protein [Tabrizicola sp.]
MTAHAQIDPATIRTAIDQARDSARQIGDLQAANARTIRTLEMALNQSIKGVLNTPSRLCLRSPNTAACTGPASRPA